MSRLTKPNAIYNRSHEVAKYVVRRTPSSAASAGHERANANAQQDGPAAERGRTEALASGEWQGVCEREQSLFEARSGG